MKNNVYVTLKYEVEANDEASMDKCVHDILGQREFFPYQADRVTYKWQIKEAVEVNMAQPVSLPPIENSTDRENAVKALGQLWEQVHDPYSDRLVTAMFELINRYDSANLNRGNDDIQK